MIISANSLYSTTYDVDDMFGFINSKILKAYWQHEQGVFVDLCTDDWIGWDNEMVQKIVNTLEENGYKVEYHEDWGIDIIFP